jgi:tetratricopeptide (TPR) repeat protein
LRFTRAPARVRIRRILIALRQAVPTVVYVAVAAAVIFDVSRLAAKPLAEASAYLTKAWTLLPPWTWTLVGLFIVVVILGVAAVPLYLFLESVLILAPPFGRSLLGVSLRRLSRQDLLLSIDAIEADMHVTRPYATVLALWARVSDMTGLLRRLSNLQETLGRNLFLRTIDNVRDGWRDGLQASILLDHLTILNRLPPQPDPDRLRGQVVTANITYLLGDLHEGRRLAELNVAEAETYDVGRLPVYQWLASYAHANSRLFLGSFEHAATLLGERWRKNYLSLSDREKQTLLSSLEPLSTLNPVAAVGRHILLASAFAAKPLMKPETNPDLTAAPATSGDWARAWYRSGMELGRAEGITEDFTQAYMALYCLLVEENEEEPLALLEQILDAAPPVSQYAKYGVRGLVRICKGDYKSALADLRRADTQSRMSGNRFFDGIYLPAHASVAMLGDPSHEPEARKIMRRARERANLARSAFYDSQLDAAQAVLDWIRGRHGQARRLMARARNEEHGLLRVYEKIFTSLGVRS